MQWTVRYFLNKSRSWGEGAKTPDASPGAKVYARRQEIWWKKMSAISDAIFKRTSTLYESIT
jgi:hypothetical protein